jgi:uncharacterized membrane protein HdeD (DUF308 family)
MLRARLRDAGDRVPPWVSALLGTVCVVVGAVVVLRPFASLALLVVAVVVGSVVLGVAELVGDRPTTGEVAASASRWSPVLRVARALTFLALAAAVALWPGPSLLVVTILVGIGLVVSGALDVLEGMLARGTERWTLVLLGVASAVLGLLALAWPDVTVLVVAVGLGVRLVLLGVRLAVSGVRRSREGGAEREGDVVAVPGGSHRAGLAGAIVAVVLATGLAGVSVAVQSGAPHPDAFYDPPADVPSEPGRLLRAEPFSRAVPDGSTAWRGR